MNDSEEKCKVSGVPLTKGKKWKGCHSRVVYRHLKKYNYNIEEAKNNFDHFIYVEELDTFYRSWFDCSKGIGKGGYDIDKKFIYEKYFQISCRGYDCDKPVPFEMVGRNACCVLHYNQATSKKYIRDEAKYVCLEDGNKFMQLNKLTNHIKMIGIDPEEYYIKHHKRHDDEGKCKWCKKPTKFKNVEVGYTNFCYNSDCNVNWYNEHENRAANCAAKISATHLEGDRLQSQAPYWIKRGYSEEEAYRKVREVQSTNTVEEIMKRKSCTLEEAISIRADITNKWLKSFPRTNYSMVSQKLFILIYEKIKNKYNEIYFATLKNGEIVSDKHNHEYRVKTHRSSRKLDFYVKDINKCIEFDGTYWHGVVGKGDKQKEIIREREIVDAIGCQVLHVKEKDFMKDPDSVVEKCVEFLNR